MMLVGLSQHRMDSLKKGTCSMGTCEKSLFCKGACRQCYFQILNQNPERRKKQRVYDLRYKHSLRGRVTKRNSRHKRKFRCRITDITTEFLKNLWEKTKICELCGKTLLADRHLDHVLPLFVGGKHLRNNVRYICCSCNLHRPKDGSDLQSSMLAPLHLPAF